MSNYSDECETCASHYSRELAARSWRWRPRAGPPTWSPSSPSGSSDPWTTSTRWAANIRAVNKPLLSCTVPVPCWKRTNKKFAKWAFPLNNVSRCEIGIFVCKDHNWLGALGIFTLLLNQITWPLWSCMHFQQGGAFSWHCETLKTRMSVDSCSTQHTPLCRSARWCAWWLAPTSSRRAPARRGSTPRWRWAWSCAAPSASTTRPRATTSASNQPGASGEWLQQASGILTAFLTRPLWQ